MDAKEGSENGMGVSGLRNEESKSLEQEGRWDED